MRKEAYVPEIIPESDLKIMTDKYRGGFRMGFGNKIGVLIVDMTYAFVDDQYRTGYSKTGKPTLKAIKRLLDKARGLGLPIFYTKAAPSNTKAGRGRWRGKRRPISGPTPPEANEIVDEIAPKDGEFVLLKSKPSAFFGTPLVSLLTYLNLDTLIVTGMVTSGCIRATIIDAFSYNYRVIVPIECVADRSQISHHVSLFDLDMKYADVTPLSEVLEKLEKMS